MISKHLVSPALGAMAILLGPSCAYLAVCAAIWFVWPSSSGWPAWVASFMA